MNRPACSVATVGVLLALLGSATAQRPVLQVNRETGVVEVISGRDLEVDGYTILSSGGHLDPEAWSSLTNQGVAGWIEANPRDQQLSELNWEGASTLAANQAVSLGAAYTGSTVLPANEDLGFRLRATDGAVIDGNIFFTGAAQVPTVTVDRASGLVELANPAGFGLTGYSIASPSGLLSASGFNGLADQGIPGWAEANPTDSLISELNPENVLAFDPSSRFSLGSAFQGGVKGQDLTFEYSSLTEVAEGVVNYVGPINDLVLQVDLVSGEGRIQNTSAAAGPFDMTGYTISSASGALSGEGWSSLADSGAGGGGWMESSADANSLAESNASGSLLFDTGTSVSIGNLLAGANDLVFEFQTADGTSQGSVEYVVNLATGEDCEAIAASRVPGDLNGDGSVAFADFLVLSANFGQDVDGYSDGDIDCNGNVSFADFLLLSANFGTEAAAGEVASVPEPMSGVTTAMGLLLLLAARRRR